MAKQEVTTNKIMEFLQDHMVVKEEFNNLRGEFNGLRGQVHNIDGRLQSLEVKVNQVKLDLIDAMDKKMANLKGDLVVLLRTEDKKVDAFIEVLRKQRTLKEHDARSLLGMSPFPQISM